MIRKIEEKDYNSVCDIYNYYIKNTTITFEEKEISYDEFAKRIDGIRAKYPYLVIEENSEILGYAYLNLFSERSAYRYTADVTIYLKNSELSKGYGTPLYKELEKEARKYGIQNLVSIITSTNEKSLAFHQKNGFVYKCEFEEVAYKFSKWIGVKYFYKRLK